MSPPAVLDAGTLFERPNWDEGATFLDRGGPCAVCQGTGRHGTEKCPNPTCEPTFPEGAGLPHVALAEAAEKEARFGDAATHWKWAEHRTNDLHEAAGYLRNAGRCGVLANERGR